MAALRRILPQRVRVRRDGEAAEIDSEEVVPGDLLLLAAGDRVAADAGLLEAERAARRRVDPDRRVGSGRARRDEVFAGTYVTAGDRGRRGRRATGMATRFGQIAALAQQTRPRRSPLERELDGMTRVVALIALSIGVVFFLVAGLAGD